MKKFALSLFACVLVFIVTPSKVNAQIEYPDKSYKTIVVQKVGFTNFTLKYERPLQRGRLIFGALVPYGKLWKTGAGFSNQLSVDQPVFVNGKKIEIGTYLLMTIPGETSWEIILHRDTTFFMNRKPYNPSGEVSRVTVKPITSSRHYEALTIDIDVENNDAVIYISWGNTQVHFKVNTHTTETVARNIHAIFQKADIKNADSFADAADFLAFNLQGLKPSAKDSAILLINKAIALDEQEWMYRVKRNVFLFSKDITGFEQTTHDWIAYLHRKKQENYEANVRVLDEEIRFYKSILK